MTISEEPANQIRNLFSSNRSDNSNIELLTNLLMGRQLNGKEKVKLYLLISQLCLNCIEEGQCGIKGGGLADKTPGGVDCLHCPQLPLVKAITAFLHPEISTKLKAESQLSS